MKYALVLTLLLTAGVVSAQDQKPLGPPASDEEPKGAPPTTWSLEQVGNVPADGRHIGLSWTRDRDPASTVVIFRRVAPTGSTPSSQGRHLHVADRAAQLIPMFMYPETYKTQYYPAFDASQHPIPKGTKLGVWTVVDAVDGDRSLWIDEVEPGSLYVYALVPAKRASAPDTYESFENSAVETPPLAPLTPSPLWHQRWFQALLAAVIAGILVAAGVVVKRRRRAGARPSGEASSTP
jgi:hypothetical protein